MWNEQVSLRWVSPGAVQSPASPHQAEAGTFVTSFLGCSLWFANCFWLTHEVQAAGVPAGVPGCSCCDTAALWPTSHFCCVTTLMTIGNMGLLLQRGQKCSVASNCLASCSVVMSSAGPFYLLACRTPPGLGFWRHEMLWRDFLQARSSFLFSAELDGRKTGVTRKQGVILWNEITIGCSILPWQYIHGISFIWALQEARVVKDNLLPADHSGSHQASSLERLWFPRFPGGAVCHGCFITSLHLVDQEEAGWGHLSTRYNPWKKTEFIDG